MKQLLLVLSLFALATSIFAQKGKIIGKVTIPDENKGALVNIGLSGTDKGTITNAAGQYEIPAVDAGNYTLVASFVGLKAERVQVTVLPGEETHVPEIFMEKNDKQLDEVVITGDRYSNYLAEKPSEALKLRTSLLKVPQNIQVITKDLLADQQAVDMLEGVTRNTSGAQMIEHWGNFARINMRGFKLPAFRNGMNVDLPWGPLTEDLSIVERIEFVKGPAGFMLSSGEPGGFYNVETKKPVTGQQNEVSMTLGSFNTLRATADLGGRLNRHRNLLYRLNIMGSSRYSHRDYEYNKRYTIAPSILYKINEHTSLTAEYIYQYSQMSVVGAAYVFSTEGFGALPRDYTLGEPNIDPTSIREHNAFVTFNHQLNKNWEFTAKAAYLDYKMAGSSLWPDSVTTAGIYRGIGVWDAISDAKLAQAFVTGEAKTGPVVHRILAGVDMGQKEYFADWFQSGPLAGPGTPLSYDNPVHYVPSSLMPVFDRSRSIRQRAFAGYLANQSVRYSALYVQDELGFFNDRLILTLAGRLTSYRSAIYSATTQDDIFTPRAGLNFSIDKNTSVYGLYDQSFIPQSGADKQGNTFEPVRGNDLEAGIKRKWAAGRWNSSLTIYKITKENVLTTDPSDPNFSIQLGEAQSKGIELDVQGEIAKGLNLILNYANTNVEVTEDTNPAAVGTRLAGHARHMTNGWLKYQFKNSGLKGLGLALGYQYQVDRSSWTWGADNEAVLPDYFRLDGAVSWKNENFTIGLNINNLLNDYLYSGSAYASYYYWQTEPGTNFRLNISYTF
ncbi:MAG: TonB-dependent receptor [Prolixibacteraceae bacterium]|jgi:iron complex outermembrane receptor protein|nr:TonB-dependent receptor [Prolixibacteraceae bacterium]